MLNISLFLENGAFLAIYMKLDLFPKCFKEAGASPLLDMVIG